MLPCLFQLPESSLAHGIFLHLQRQLQWFVFTSHPSGHSYVFTSLFVCSPNRKVLHFEGLAWLTRWSPPGQSRLISSLEILNLNHICNCLFYPRFQGPRHGCLLGRRILFCILYYYIFVIFQYSAQTLFLLSIFCFLRQSKGFVHPVL